MNFQVDKVYYFIVTIPSSRPQIYHLFTC